MHIRIFNVRLYRCALDSGVFRVALNLTGWVAYCDRRAARWMGYLYEIDDSKECVLNIKKINRIRYMCVCVI